MKRTYITPATEVISYEIEAVMLNNSPVSISTKDEEYGEEGWSNKKNDSHPIWK